MTDYIDCESLADTCEDNLAEIEDIMEVPEHSEGQKCSLKIMGRKRICI